ncbi:hypothetical protein DL96DRAFT_1607572 [Flagelloscypha sp. PMI_526]|nr:hypothetical protein DL96DRAFT_1607572 [Flagelloscypha sp. PMI_526]
MVLVGIYVAILVTCCLIFFSSVAIGHVLFLHSKKAVHPKPDGRDEYISSVLASGLFLLIMTGPFFLTDILSSDWDYDDYCGPWTILACSLLILGPACIALSSEILRVTHMVVVTVKEVVLHYTVGYLVILGAVVLWIVIVASWGN